MSQPPESGRTAIVVPVLAGLAVSVFFIVGNAGMGLLLFAAGPAARQGSDYFKLLLSASFLFPVVVLVLIVRALEKRGSGAAGFRYFGKLVTGTKDARFFQYMALLLALPIGMQILGTELETLTKMAFPWEDDYQALIALLSPTGSLVDEIGAVVTIGLVGPLCEEVLFRGLILGRFLAKWPSAPALIFQAILFGGVHMNPWQSAYGIPVGIVLGLAYLWTGGIAGPFIVHAVNNLAAVAILYHFPEIPYFHQRDFSGLEHLPAPLLALGAVLLTGALYLLYRTRPASAFVPVPSEEQGA